MGPSFLLFGAKVFSQKNVEDFNLTLYISFPLRATFFDLLGLEDSTSISVLRTHFFGKIVKSSHPKRIVFRPSFLRGELLNFRGESSMKFAGCLFPDFFACKYQWRSGTRFHCGRSRGKLAEMRHSPYLPHLPLVGKLSEMRHLPHLPRLPLWENYLKCATCPTCPVCPVCPFAPLASLVPLQLETLVVL